MLHHHQSYRILNFWLLPLCKRLCHRLPDVVLSVCLLSWTHTLLKCKLGSLSVLMPLNSGMPEVLHARGPSGLARLAKDLICVPASQACVEHIFFICGLLYYGRRSSMFRSRDESLSKTQSDEVLKETSSPQ